VYKPNDDTYLILSTLKHELPSFGPDLFVCELGSGSGIISANFNHWLSKEGKGPLLHVSIDINMDASLFSQKYYDTYQLNITQINASLFNNFRFKVPEGQPKPDIVIFNPPYVPVEQEELDNEQKYLAKKLKYVREQRSTIRDKEQNMIAFSYMGGLDGLAITRKILKQLTWNCTFYFIVMEEEGLHQITKEIQDASALSEKHVFKAELRVLQYAQFYNEHLYVLRLILSIL
jgi:methylase of polypeptide subunit release factors